MDRDGFGLGRTTKEEPNHDGTETGDREEVRRKTTAEEGRDREAFGRGLIENLPRDGIEQEVHDATDEDDDSNGQETSRDNLRAIKEQGEER